MDGSRTGNSRHCLNLGSYNYLGFAAQDEYCTPRVVKSLDKFAISTCASRADGGKFRSAHLWNQLILISLTTMICLWLACLNVTLLSRGWQNLWYLCQVQLVYMKSWKPSWPISLGSQLRWFMGWVLPRIQRRCLHWWARFFLHLLISVKV